MNEEPPESSTEFAAVDDGDIPLWEGYYVG